MKKITALLVLSACTLTFASESTSTINNDSVARIDLSKGLQLESSFSQLNVSGNKDITNVNGISLGIRKNYYIKNKFSASTGVSYSKFASSENLKISGSATNTDSLDVDLSIITLSQRLHYNIIANHVLIKPYAGLSMSIGKADINSLASSKVTKLDGSLSLNQLIIGTEFHLTNKVAIDLRTSVLSNMKLADDSLDANVYSIGLNYSL